MFSPGLEFDLPGGWPFLSGGIIRFGPSAGVSYNDLSINNISDKTGCPAVTARSWEHLQQVLGVLLRRLSSTSNCS